MLCGVGCASTMGTQPQYQTQHADNEGGREGKPAHHIVTDVCYVVLSHHDDDLLPQTVLTVMAW